MRIKYFQLFAFFCILLSEVRKLFMNPFTDVSVSPHPSLSQVSFLA